MEVNARIPLALDAACIDHMGAHGGGRVVLIGSVAGPVETPMVQGIGI